VQAGATVVVPVDVTGELGSAWSAIATVDLPSQLTLRGGTLSGSASAAALGPGGVLTILDYSTVTVGSLTIAPGAVLRFGTRASQDARCGSGQGYYWERLCRRTAFLRSTVVYVEGQAVWEDSFRVSFDAAKVRACSVAL
jgi:hypothetical protein